MDPKKQNSTQRKRGTTIGHLLDAQNNQTPHSGRYQNSNLKIEQMSVFMFRESLCWRRMTRTARQDARRSGKEDAGHSLFLWKMPLRILRGTQ